MPALTKWLAAKNSFEAHPAAFCGAILLYSLGRVLGAAWGEPAMLSQEGAQNQLVSANYGEKNLFHC